MFKIHYTNGNISNAFASVQQAIDWGKMTSYEFDIIDSDGIIVHHYAEAEQCDHDFIDIGTMSYDQVRKMNHE